LTPEEQEQIDLYNELAEERATQAMDRIQQGESFDAVARDVSDDEQSKNNGGYLGFIGPDIVFPELYGWAESAQEGEISSTVIETDASYEILKRGGSQTGEAQTRASHILICYLGARNCDAPIYT